MNKTKNIFRTPAAALYSGALRRGLWMPITYSIFLIVCISFTGSRFAYYNNAWRENYAEWLLSRLDSYLPFFGLSIIVAALVGCTVFSYINRVSSACFVHGLPVGRTGIFFAHYGAGATMLLIPILAASVYVGFHTGNAHFGLLFLVVNLLYSIGVMSFAILVCQISANILGGIIFTGFGLATPIICEGFVIYLMEENLYGYAGTYSDLAVSRVFYLVPSMVPTAWGLVYVFAIALFTAVGLLLFKKRAVELAGDLIAFAGIRKAAVYVCGILAGMCAYLIFDANLFMFLLFGVLCAVLVNFAIRKRFTVKGAITPALTVLATTVLIFVIFRFDLTGFERRIPDLEDIESARVHTGYYNDAIRDIDGKRVQYVDFHEPIRGEENIERVRVLHKDLIGNKDFYASADHSRYYTVEYTLKSGRTFERRYQIYYDKNAEAFEPVATLREFKRNNHDILEDDISIVYAEVEGIYGKTERFEGARADMLYRAVVEDILTVPYEQDHDLHRFAADRYVTVYFRYFYNNAVYLSGIPVERSVLAQIDRGERVAVSPSYKNTMAVLRDICPELVDINTEIPDNSSLVIEYFVETQAGMNAFTTERYETAKITDKAAIVEIMAEVVRLSDKRVLPEITNRYYYLSFNIGDTHYVSATVSRENDVIGKYVDDSRLVASSTYRGNPEIGTSADFYDTIVSIG